jgi:predicted nucleic acid-binding protein
LPRCSLELIPDALWTDVGTNAAFLRHRGLTVPFADVVIATVAVNAGMELWTYDNHFPLVQAVLPQLQLFQEPP